VKCYFHDQRDAVGFCVTCGRAMCKQCAVTVGGRLHCESCYIESQLGPETQTPATEGRTKPNAKVTPRPMLLSIGALGSLVGVVIPVVSFLLFSLWPEGPYSLLPLIAVMSLLTGLWFGVQAVGFFGIYRSYNEIMGLAALVFGVITAVADVTLGAALLIIRSVYYYYSLYTYVPLIYQAVTTAVQATAFLSIRQQSGNEKLFVATAIALVAAGSISWLTIVGPVLSVSNVFVAICFLKIQMTPESEPKSKPQEPIIDPLKELQ